MLLFNHRTTRINKTFSIGQDSCLAHVLIDNRLPLWIGSIYLIRPHLQDFNNHIQSIMDIASGIDAHRMILLGDWNMVL